VKGTRGGLFDRLAGRIESVTTVHPLRFAVDGRGSHLHPTGANPTTGGWSSLREVAPLALHDGDGVDLNENAGA
jgi:hypothetical protein